MLVAEHALLGLYTTDGYTKVATEIILDRKPDILLMGATPNGRDLAGRLAVRLRTGLTADCTDLRLEEEGLLSGQVTGFGGGVLAYIKCPNHRPQMFTVRPGVFSAPAPNTSRKGKVTSVPVELSEDDVKVQVLEHVIGEGVDITRADVIVAAGRGCRGDFSLVQELAGLLGGEVGWSRVPVDEGWVSRRGPGSRYHEGGGHSGRRARLPGRLQPGAGTGRPVGGRGGLVASAGRRGLGAP